MCPVPDVEPSASGTLAKTPLPHLIVYMLDRTLEGSILLQAADGSEHTVYFARGAPAKARTAYQCNFLGRVLLDLGFIDQTTHDRTLSTLAQSGGLHGELLVSLGKINRAQLIASLREQLMQRMLRLFEKLDDATSYAFYAGTNLLADFGGPELTAIDPLRVVCSGARARPDLPHIDLALARLGSAPLIVHPAHTDLSRFGFTKPELAVIDLLRARATTLSDILASALLPERHLKLLIYVLLITRNIDIGARDQKPVGGPADDAPPSSGSTVARVKLKAVPLPRVASAPGAPAPTAAATSSSRMAAAPPAASIQPPPAVRAVDGVQPAPKPDAAGKQDAKLAAQREMLLTRADTIDKENFFDVLGVPENASLDVVQSTYFQLAKQFHPDRLVPQLADVREQAAKCFGRISEAFQTLTDPEKRARYLELLHAQANDSAGDEGQVQRIVQATIDFQKAEVLMRKRDFEQAHEYAKHAFEADPDQPDYAALYAWTLVSLAEKQNKPSDFVEPLRTLTAAIDRNPKCERALFYRASILKRAGQTHAALRDFKRVMELNPRNIDAVREVRLAEMRSQHPGPAEPKNAPTGKDAGLLGRLFKR